MRHRLREQARKLLPDERVGSCMRKRTGKVVSMVKTEFGSHWSNVAVCGSVWHCPTCAAKISERRRQEVETAARSWMEDDRGALVMLTLTVPHGIHQTLADVKGRLLKARSLLVNRKPWRKLKERVGLFGDIKVMEVTEGEKNGWHPHYHCLLFVENPDISGHEIKQQLYESWRSAAVRAGLSEPTWEAGVHATVRNDPQAAEEAARYTTKELAYGSRKKAKGGGLAPFQMLERIDEIDQAGGPKTEAERQEKERLEARFREYAEEFKGSQQMRWSDGLKDYFGLKDQADQDLAEEEREDGETLVELGPEAWKQVVAERAQAVLLDIGERGGRDAVLAWLMARGLWEASELDHRRAYGWRFDDPV